MPSAKASIQLILGSSLLTIIADQEFRELRRYILLRTSNFLPMQQIALEEVRHLTGYSGFSNFSQTHSLQLEYKVNSWYLKVWQHVGITDPRSLYLVICITHLLFLSLYGISRCWKYVKSRNQKDSIQFQISWGKKGIVDSRSISAGKLYTVTISICIYLCICYMVTAGWSIVSILKKGWHHFLLVSLTSSLQTSTCLVMTVAAMKAKAEGKAFYPRLLRAWWISAFFMNAMVFSIEVSILDLKKTFFSGLQIDALMDLLALPAHMLLCVAATYGRTGVKRMTLEGPYEYLLNSYFSDLPASENTKQRTGYATANLLSLITFSWLNSLLVIGYKKPLKLDDIPPLAEKDCASSVDQLFWCQWFKQEPKSLVKCLAMSLWKEAIINASFAGFCVCTSYVGPYLVDDFVECLAGRKRFAHEGYVLASMFFVAKLIESIAQRQWYFGAQQMGLRVNAGLSAMIYKKGLNLSNQSRQDHSSGEIVNYVSVDVQRLCDFSWYLHELWLLPVQITLALLILYKNIGVAAFATLGATALTMLANIPLSTLLEKSQTDIMEAKDARMRATSEVLRSMRILKLQAWEMKYLHKIESLRKVEYGWLRRFLYVQSGVVALFWCTPAVVAVVTFVTCVLIGIPLTSGKVLSALAIFKILQDPIYGIPDFIGMLAETKVSVQRLEKFLQTQEMDPQSVDHSPVLNEDNQMAIEIQDACFSWDSRGENPSLCVRELQISRGSRVAVCGQVGSGKSSLISCILGELPKISGTVKVQGSRAYVPQSPWIQTGTIQDNILFGRAMNKKRYEHVLSICSLTKDLEHFAHGDQTEIGERGINLSGGQKQRIQLARALYEDADIYLLDDPFSAVDAHTGSHLFQKCILEMLQGKTVIYVTHQVEFLPAADKILVIEGGIVVESGSFHDLIGNSGVHLRKLIGAHTQALESIENAQDSSLLKDQTKNVDSERQEDNQELKMAEDLDGTNGSAVKKQLVQDEARETGRVSMKVYWSLVTTAYKGSLVPFLLLAQALFQCMQIASSYWMAWATPVTIDEHAKVSRRVLLIVFLALAFASSLCILTRALLLATIALKTAQKFFLNMLHSIFHAPMSFFDATPAGRILSRVSTDQSALDLEVCNRLAGLAFNIIQLTGIITVMSQASWLVFAMFIPVAALSLWIQQFYITSARELARLVGIRRAPILHHLGESISGAPTIRGFAQESRFTDTNLQLIDDYCKPVFHNFAAMEWLCLRLNFLSSVVFVSSLVMIVSFPVGTIDASIAGLAVTYGLNLNYLQYIIIWNLSNLENKIISVERIEQYTHIPSEAPLVVDNERPPSDWPQKGTIAIENLQVQYAPHMPMVLRGITCTFFGGQKIGVVGRTGSGKSTLIQALFRIVEPAAGKILIDDVDISRIGLHDLRSKLSIIPQEPTLFEGTIRSNLDPLMQHSDGDIWKALDKSQLGDVVRSKEEKLNAIVSENGENWSVGQRQLFCLGRALLKRSQILVLDEATASVDTVTDGVIQDTIRSEFTECTIITIAHRIPTVIDSDRVLYLSEGRVAEYDSPRRLLDNRSSLFAQLVLEYTQRSSSDKAVN